MNYQSMYGALYAKRSYERQGQVITAHTYCVM